GNNLFVANAFYGTVGEYTTSGAMINGSLISGLNYPTGITISGNDLFVADYEGGTVGEYTIGGATINVSLISGLSYPSAVAISGNKLFVANFGSGTVGEYGLDGSIVNASLISGINSPAGIAFSSVPEPSAGALAGLVVAALALWRRSLLARRGLTNMLGVAWQVSPIKSGVNGKNV
ncbi:MAG TPA: PEP-CTERM sorting domain-containing protein, partial [Candidatus Angelobacter sp.]|nr:PEP-CTERM sorting domain-containing protein [Candidatus Angelobacter sp.]